MDTFQASCFLILPHSFNSLRSVELMLERYERSSSLAGSLSALSFSGERRERGGAEFQFR